MKSKISGSEVKLYRNSSILKYIFQGAIAKVKYAGTEYYNKKTSYERLKNLQIGSIS